MTNIDSVVQLQRAFCGYIEGLISNSCCRPSGSLPVRVCIKIFLFNR